MHSSRSRWLRSVSAIVAPLLIAVAIPATVWAQAALPRTPWGTPDLNGIWSHGTATPLERAEQQVDRELLTEAEIAEIDAAQRAEPGSPAPTRVVTGCGRIRTDSDVVEPGSPAPTRVVTGFSTTERRKRDAIRHERRRRSIQPLPAVSQPLA